MINAPRPIAPKNSLEYTFLDFNPLELARQITLMDHELFCKIKSRELICSNRVKESKEIKSSNVYNYLNWERNVINWLVTEIISQGNQKLLIQTVERIISIAQHMEKLNNFSGIKMIITVLKSPAVYQLKKIKDVIYNLFYQLVDWNEKSKDCRNFISTSFSRNELQSLARQNSGS